MATRRGPGGRARQRLAPAVEHARRAHRARDRRRLSGRDGREPGGSPPARAGRRAAAAAHGGGGRTDLRYLAAQGYRLMVAGPDAAPRRAATGARRPICAARALQRGRDAGWRCAFAAAGEAPTANLCVIVRQLAGVVVIAGALSLVPAQQAAASSANVAALQVALKAIGLYPVAVDGVKGPLRTAWSARLPAAPASGRRRRRRPADPPGSRPSRPPERWAPA